MILRSSVNVHSDTWQQRLADAVTSVEELLCLLDLPPQRAAATHQASAQFPLRVPRGYVGLMRKGDPDDPLLRQVLPLAEETDVVAGFCTDPVGDHAAISAQGLLEKYRDRALLLTTGACAIHCRYCFRRHFPYADQNGLRDHWQPALDQLRQQETREVILSGGDPLSLSNPRLEALFVALGELPALRRIRLHSRYPVVLPERIDQGLLNLTAVLPGRPVMVIHCNHPHELGTSARQALAQLADAGWALFNQSVLLRGVNDTVATLEELSETLFELGVQPYYLHQLDPVQGAAHFAVADHQALTLQRELLARLPGYLVPRLVREIPGAPSKTAL